MKHLSTAAGILAIAFAAQAQAQAQGPASSSVSIYGSIDGGYDYLSNAGNGSLSAINTGRRSPDRLGFRGREDLGGGLAASFRMEHGFNGDTGSQTNATTFWNRHTSVAIEQRGIGQIALGHLPDYMYEFLPAHSNGVPGISAAFSPGNFDNLANRLQQNNSIKVQTDNIAGFTAGAMLGLSEAGGTKHSRSFGLRYDRQALRVSAAYAYYPNRAVELRNTFGLTSFLGTAIAPNTNYTAREYRGMGIGASYTIGLFTPHILYTDVSLGNGNADESVRNTYAGLIIDVSGGKKINTVHVSGSRTKLLDRSMDQLNLFASHQMSRLTQVYAAVSFQKASNTRAGLFGYSQSSDDRQTLARVGLNVNF